MHLPRTAAILVPVFLSACSAATDRPQPIVEQWEIDAVLTIGGADSGPASFTQIQSVDADHDGRILILDNEAQRIELFDSNGAHLRTIGRKGAGPGEFQKANGFRIAPDGSIWVNNPNTRISIFTPDGALQREIPLRINSYSIREWEAWFEGEALLEIIDVRQDSVYVDHIRRFHPTGLIDTMPMPCEGVRPVPGRADRYIINHARGSTSFFVPWAPQGVRVVDRRGNVWCGSTDRYLLRRIGVAGGDTVTLQGSRLPSPVTARDRDSIIAMLRRVLLRKMDLPDPDWSRIPATKPILDDVRIDGQGRVWVHVAVDGPVQLWDVFSAEGNPVAEIRSNVAWSRWGPMSIRDSVIYGVVIDSNDVPAVVKGRIRRR